MKTLLHVDMDAFFASVELIDHPEWRGLPLIVGAGPDERGVVSTCSYEARRFGVHSAMPSRTAYQRCPQAIFVHPSMEKYEAVSKKVFGIFTHYSPYIEAVSIDEAFLDITGTIHLFGSAEALGEALREEVRREAGVTCSIGIAPNRLLAKIGSEQHKPDGLTMMPFEENAIAEFLYSKPVGILWGVGKSTIENLKQYGIHTCGDIQRWSREESGRNILGAQLVDYAFGRCDDTVYWEETEAKSVSREYTFDVDEGDRSSVRSQLLKLVTEVGRTFRRKGLWAKTARIKLRDVDFNTCTRQIGFEKPAMDEMSFKEAALALFDREFSPKLPYIVPKLRLIGFGVTNFVNSPDGGGGLLFADECDKRREKRERLSTALDSLRDRGIDI